MKKIQKSLVKFMFVLLAAVATSVPLQAQVNWKDGKGYSGVIGWSVVSGADEIYARTAVAYASPGGPCLKFDYRTWSQYSGEMVADSCIMGSSTFQRSIRIRGVQGSYSKHKNSSFTGWSLDNITSPTYY